METVLEAIEEAKSVMFRGENKKWTGEVLYRTARLPELTHKAMESDC